jgi:hypothetical protein
MCQYDGVLRRYVMKLLSPRANKICNLYSHSKEFVTATFLSYNEAIRNYKLVSIVRWLSSGL